MGASTKTLPFLLVFLIFCFYMAMAPFMTVSMRAPEISIPITGGEDMDYGDQYFQSHADEKHPAEAVRVRECLVNKGMHSLWKEPNRGTFLQVCQIDETQWGIRVCKSQVCSMEDEITAFIKGKMSRWDQVLKYLSNNGAIQVR